MKTSLKNFTKVLLGVAVLGGAALTQSFIKKPESNKKLSGEIFVNTSTSGSYTKLSNPGDYDPNNCENTSSENCAWQRTNTPGTVPDNFDAATAESLHQAGLIEPLSNKQGMYVE